MHLELAGGASTLQIAKLGLARWNSRAQLVQELVLHSSHGQDQNQEQGQALYLALPQGVGLEYLALLPQGQALEQNRQGQGRDQDQKMDQDHDLDQDLETDQDRE
jgi:hypothetical protein